MSLTEELKQVPSLLHPAQALVAFAEAIGSVTFHAEGERWVARPHNFVTFKVQAARKQDLVVTLRGNPFEFETQEEIKLKADRPGHSRFNFGHPRELQAAATYIKRAHQLYQRGAGRPPKTPRTTEA